MRFLQGAAVTVAVLIRVIFVAFMIWMSGLFIYTAISINETPIRICTYIVLVLAFLSPEVFAIDRYYASILRSWEAIDLAHFVYDKALVVKKLLPFLNNLLLPAALGHMADSFVEQGHNEEAEDYYGRALEAYRQCIARPLSGVGSSILRHATILSSTGDSSTADILKEEFMLQRRFFDACNSLRITALVVIALIFPLPTFYFLSELEAHNLASERIVPWKPILKAMDVLIGKELETVILLAMGNHGATNARTKRAAHDDRARQNFLFSEWFYREGFNRASRIQLDLEEYRSDMEDCHVSAEALARWER